MSMTETETGILTLVASASTRSARSLASLSKSIVSPFSDHECVNWNLLVRTEERLAPRFSDVESQAIFRISRFLKSLVEQLFDFLLRGWPRDRFHASIPPGCNFDVGRQTRVVYKAFGIADGPLIERADPSRERINKRVEVGVGQRPIYVAVALSP